MKGKGKDMERKGKGRGNEREMKGKGKGKEMKRKGIYAVFLRFKPLHMFYNYCFLHNHVVWSKLTIVFHYDLFHDQFFGVHLLAISWIDISNQGKEKRRKGKGKGKGKERK